MTEVEAGNSSAAEPQGLQVSLHRLTDHYEWLCLNGTAILTANLLTWHLLPWALSLPVPPNKHLNPLSPQLPTEGSSEPGSNQ